MKKIVVLAAILFSVQLQAQIKEGFAKFAMDIEGENSGMASAIMANSTLTLYFKNEKSLAEIVSQMYSMKTFTDSKGTLVLMDAMGQKTFYRSTLADKEKKNNKEAEPVILYTKETKKILGYDCSKALVTNKDASGKGSQVITVWYTDKIQTNTGLGLISPEILAKFKGMVLEAEMARGPVKTKITAKQISVKPVADAVFAVSTNGYTEIKKGK
ncbi:MAG: hypothetical protein V4450_09510 [Bacteroidota bacterium]